jgi:hypothetical protein
MTPAQRAAALLAHPGVVWPPLHREALEAIAEGREPDADPLTVQVILEAAEAAVEAAELAVGVQEGQQ